MENVSDEAQRAEKIRKDVHDLAVATNLSEKETWDRLVKNMPEIAKYRPKDI